MNERLELLAAFAEATHETHVERMLVAIADAFAHTLEVERVELVNPGESRLALRRRESGEWGMVRTSSDARARGRRAELTLALEDSCTLELWLAQVPSWVEDPSLHRALERLLDRGRKSQTIVRRVADVSRRAHVAKRELQRRLESGPRLIARSPAMRELEVRARAVAPYPTSVLITGESGVGKEVVASFVHAHSTRARAAFVRINCGALPETLAESELFGHEAGAFTGASRRHRGVFERADRGTLFLDEVGELTPNLQVKLLRTLQQGELTRVGGERTICVDVRVIAATNRPLDQLLARGGLREDLYFRLAVFPLVVPSLRERVEDIPVLVDELVEELCARLGRARPRIDERTLARLLGHRWPGNVRELANTLEAALISSGELLTLPEGSAVTARASTDVDVIPSFEQGTRALIERALAACKGKIYGPGGAAELLELHPGTLQGKMRRLGITREDFVDCPE